MRIMLRLIAIWNGLSGGAIALLAILLLVGGGVPEAARARAALGLLTLSGPIGVFSAVQLFRLRESGRRAALAFVAALALFTIAQYRSLPQPTLGIVFKLALAVGAVAVLLSGRARRVCAKDVARGGGRHEVTPGSVGPPEAAE